MDSGSPIETPADDGSLTRGFLFADLRGYTDFVETHGDHAAAALLERYRALVRARVSASRGAEIKTEGDSFYVVFPSAGAAVRCGLAIIAAAAEPTTDGPSHPIFVGVGVHAGETVETAEGFVGSVVNIAARICAQAKAGELVVSDTVRSLTRTYLDVRFEPLGARKLKGVDEPIPLYRVVPASGAAPARAGRTSAARRRPRVIAGLVALGLVGVAIVAGALWLGGRGSAGPTPSTAAATTPTAAGSSGAASANVAVPSGAAVSGAAPSSAAGASDTGRTAEERALLNHIPLEFQPYCRRSSLPDGSAGGAVSLRCDLPPDFAGYGADSAWYDTFDSKSAMQIAFNALAGREQLAGGDCTTSTKPATGRWALGSTFTGQLACYTKEKAAWLMWTYEGEQILVRAVRRDGDPGALRTWWHERAADFLR